MMKSKVSNCLSKNPFWVSESGRSRDMSRDSRSVQEEKSMGRRTPTVSLWSKQRMSSRGERDLRNIFFYVFSGHCFKYPVLCVLLWGMSKESERHRGIC